MGTIVIKLPLPPGLPADALERRRAVPRELSRRLPGYYNTSDAGFLDEDGYVYVMGRTDDIINVAGHRLSTGGMEEVLASHPAVAECAVIGVRDSLKGEVPCGFVVLKSGVDRPPTEIEAELVGLVRDRIGPVAAFKLAVTVGRLPKTRSGKILRGTMKKIADGEDLGDARHDRRSGDPRRDRRGAEGEGPGPEAIPAERNDAAQAEARAERPGPAERPGRFGPFLVILVVVRRLSCFSLAKTELTSISVPP